METEKTILVADDEEGVRKVLCDFFKQKKFQVIQASTGVEAVQLVQTRKPDILLLDVNMPDMDGLTVLSRLMEFEEKPSVLMITGQEDQATVQAALDRGASGYIFKPFDFLHLELLVISKILSKNKKGDESNAK